MTRCYAKGARTTPNRPDSYPVTYKGARAFPCVAQDLRVTVSTAQWRGNRGVLCPRRSDHEDESILGIPNMLRAGTIPPQPEDTVDPPQKEGRLIIAFLATRMSGIGRASHRCAGTIPRA